MGTSLTGKNISASYLGLLKTTDNAIIGSTAKRLTDGGGTDSPLYLSTTQLGIGVSPMTKLHVQGTDVTSSPSAEQLIVAENNGNTAIGIFSSLTGQGSIDFGDSADNNAGRILYEHNDNALRFSTNGSSKMSILSDGKIGIGTSTVSSSAFMEIKGVGSLSTAIVKLMPSDASSTTALYNASDGGDNGMSQYGTVSGDTILQHIASSGELKLRVNGTTGLTMNQSQNIKLDAYGSGTITGTATQRLGVDSSGNVIEIPIGAGAVDGSGTANTVTMWSDTDTITDAPITISGNNSTFSGDVFISQSNTDAVPTNNLSGDELLNISNTDNSGVYSALKFRTRTSGAAHSLVGLRMDSVYTDAKFFIRLRNAGLTSQEVFNVGNTGATFAGSVSVSDGVQKSKFETNGNDLYLVANSGQTNVSPNFVFKSSVSGGTINEKMRLDSSGRLGIGLTPTTVNLEVKSIQDSSFDEGIGVVRSNSSQTGYINMVGGAMNINAPNAIPIKFRDGGNTNLTIGGDGNATFAGDVTIGSTTGISASTKLAVSDTNGAGLEVIPQTSNDRVTLLSYDRNASTYQTLDTDSSDVHFNISGSERMRLDSSGNLLVGKTSNTLATAGAKLGTGGSNFTRDSAEVVFVNRTTDDGSAITIAKDGTSVGVIGTQNWGIGTASPTNSLNYNTLDIRGTSGAQIILGRTAMDFFLYSTSTSSHLGSSTGQALVFHTNSTGVANERLRITSGGKVGISTTNAIMPLTIKGDVSRNAIAIFNSGSGTEEGILYWYSSDETTIRAGISGNENGLDFKTGSSATNRMRITSAGNVGIGTTSPNIYSLTDATNILSVQATGSNKGGIIDISASGTGYSGINLGNETIRRGGIYTLDGSSLVFYTNATNSGTSLSERMRITSGGDVDITGGGILKGMSHLELKNNGGSDGTATSPRLYSPASGTLAFSANGSERMRIDSSGNLGLGTSSPLYKLHVEDSGDSEIVTRTTSNTDSAYFVTWNNNASSGNNMQIRSYGQGETGTVLGNSISKANMIWSSGASLMAIGNISSTPLIFGTGNTERMRIASSGDVLIGTTSTSVSNNGFVHFSTGRFSCTQTSEVVGIINRRGTDGEAIRFLKADTDVGSIDVTTTATTYNTSSDYRLKEDLQDFNALEIASKIKMYDFKWKADDSRSYGVMAHELQEVLPQAVSGEKDAEEMQSVDYSKLVPILLKSIQELEARVKELEKEI